MNKPSRVSVYDDGEGWTLVWYEGEQEHQRLLYGNNTPEEAIQDAVDYFGGLITAEEVTVTPATSAP